MKFLFSIFLLLNAAISFSQEQAFGTIKMTFESAEMDVNKADTVIIAYINRDSKISTTDSLYLKSSELIQWKKMEVGNYDMHLSRGKSFNYTIQGVLVSEGKITFLDKISLDHVPVENPRKIIRCHFNINKD